MTRPNAPKRPPNHSLAGVGVFPVEGHVEALLVELQEHLGGAVIELAHHVVLLALEGLAF